MPDGDLYSNWDELIRLSEASALDLSNALSELTRIQPIQISAIDTSPQQEGVIRIYPESQEPPISVSLNGETIGSIVNNGNGGYRIVDNDNGIKKEDFIPTKIFTVDNETVFDNVIDCINEMMFKGYNAKQVVCEHIKRCSPWCFPSQKPSDEIEITITLKKKKSKKQKKHE